MKIQFKLVVGAAILASLASCSKDPSYAKEQAGNKSESTESLKTDSKPEAVVIKATGEINDALDQFRQLIGPQVNTTPGAVGGHRQVNWDGVPAAFTNNNLFPGDFFGSSNPTDLNGRKRGLICTTPGVGFSIDSTDFARINATYDHQFNTFSPKRTFIAVGSTITDNFFKVPGSNTDATVQGFGVVFSDVNNASSTSLEFYDGERLLGSFKVPNVGNNNPGGFSFLGVYFPHERVSRVRIHSGSAPLSPTQNDLSDGGGEDLVIMDDFFYSEPTN